MSVVLTLHGLLCNMEVYLLAHDPSKVYSNQFHDHLLAVDH